MRKTSPESVVNFVGNAEISITDVGLNRYAVWVPEEGRSSDWAWSLPLIFLL